MKVSFTHTCNKDHITNSYRIDDHNINTTTTPSNNDNRHGRQHQTLSTIIDSFLTQDTQGTSDNSREAFTNALRIMNTEEGLTLALELMNSLENSDLNFNDNKEKGVSQDFLDSLERVSINDLPNKDTADCPICTNKFIEDKYPLLVKLPCSVQQINGKEAKGHIFDLECIGPWLKVNSTCPLCRFDVLEVNKKRKEKLEEELRKAKEEDDEEEEEDWDDYG